MPNRSRGRYWDFPNNSRYRQDRSRSGEARNNPRTNPQPRDINRQNPWSQQRSSGLRSFRPKRTQSSFTPLAPFQRTITKKIFDLIRMIHHLENISPETTSRQPPTFRLIVEYLSSVIKPAALRPDTQLLLEGNAKNWAYTTQLILDTHYKDGITQLLEELKSLRPTNWREALRIASNWAQRKFGRRLHQGAVDKTRELLQDFLDMDETPSSKLTDKTTVQTQTDPSPDSHLPEGVHLPEVSHLPEGSRSPEVSHLPEGSIFQESDFPCLGEPSITLSPHNPFRKDILPQSVRPLEQRQPRVRNPCVVLEEDPLLDIQTQILDTQTPSKPVPMVPMVPLTQKSPPLRQKSPTPPAEVLVEMVEVEEGPQAEGPTVQDPGEDSSLPPSDSEGDDIPLSEFLVPPPRKFAPIRHLNIRQKMSQWTLTPRKKFLIMGDSNLSRIPGFDQPDLQIDSFPGGTFRHAEGILDKIKPTSVQVEKLVLSFGVLHMDQDPKRTAVKQLQRALKMAKDKFPSAEIWIPLINFSDNLDPECQDNLTELNRHIQANMPFIPKLPADVFQTTADNIHWTKTTADAMLHHWIRHLNL